MAVMDVAVITLLFLTVAGDYVGLDVSGNVGVVELNHIRRTQPRIRVMVSGTLCEDKVKIVVRATISHNVVLITETIRGLLILVTDD